MISFYPNQQIKSADLNANFSGLADGSELLDGAVDQVKISNPYKFRAYRSASYNGTSGAVVQLNATDFDTSDAYNTSTYTYTIPVSGYWYVSAQVISESSGGTGYFAYLKVNGTTNINITGGHIAYYSNTGTYARVAGSTIYYFEAGDTVKLYWAGITGAAGTIAAGRSATNMSGFLVSGT